MQRIVKTVMLAVILLGWARSGAAQSKPARLEEARSVTKDAAERPAAHNSSSARCRFPPPHSKRAP